MTSVLYVDVDGTLVGPGGDLLSEGTEVVDALLLGRRAGLDVVPVSGRGRIQMRELCRLLGFGRGIGELGCVHVEGHSVTFELGRFPADAGLSPVETLLTGGAIEVVVAAADVEPHEPWNENRNATYLLRGHADLDKVDEALAAAGFEWCQIVDNGTLARGGHAYHLAPRGTGKREGVALDLARRGIARQDSAFVGDSSADLGCKDEVGEMWLVANADAALSGRRTSGSYGAGVAEVIHTLLDSGPRP